MHPYFNLNIDQIPVGGISSEEYDDIGFSSELFEQDKIDLIQKDEEGEANLKLSVKDNGIHGDGLVLSIEGDVEVSAHQIKTMEIASIKVPSESIDILIAALLSVKKLREAQSC